MTQNVYSIKDFLKKKGSEKYFARNRRPLVSILDKRTRVFESFNELNERMDRFEQKCSMLSTNYGFDKSSITCGSSR